MVSLSFTTVQESCSQTKALTEHLAEAGRSGAGRQVDANVVDGRPRQRHGDAHQRVDGVTVERHRHEEHAAQAVDHWEE